MKLQLKRSNVLDGSVAKPPTAPQMEYGELAVNYNADDPVIFIKDSDGLIIRLTNRSPKWSDIIGKPDVNDGAINVSGGEGITATGSNATANQSADTTRTLSVDASWLNSWIGSNITPANNGQINISGGTGITATGSNATANQGNNTTRTLEVDTTWLAAWLGANAINDGQINVSAGSGLTATGSNATANQAGNTTRVLAIDTTWLADYVSQNTSPANNGQINVTGYWGITANGQNATADQSINTTQRLYAVADPGKGIKVTATGIGIGDAWTNIPALP